MNFKVLCAAGALLASQSFAIIGIGGHYAPGFGTKMSGMDAPASVTEDGNIQIQHEGFSGTMQGFGFKLWVDILPIIDVEATLNIQLGSYDATLFVKNPLDPTAEPQDVKLEIELGGTPFAKANPKFVQMNGDLSITYPITFLPIIRPYIGGGITYYLNTFILNESFTSKTVGAAYNTIMGEVQKQVDGIMNDPSSLLDPNKAMPDANQLTEMLIDELTDNIQDAALDEGLKTSIGGHILVGLRAKLPIIPIAAYANFKYYFGGDYPTEIDAGNMTAEIGVGLAL